MNPEFYKIITNHLNAKSENTITILDVGCAEVRPYSEYLIETSDKYVGIDINKILIDKAKKKFSSPKCEFLLMTVEDLKLQEGSFDIIVCNNMLAYTNQRKTLKRIYALLKENGLCISFNNNTIGYSLHKILKPFKPWYLEFLHSMIVILNTWTFNLLHFRFFSTIYNTLTSLKKNLYQYHFKSFHIQKSKTELPYRVIDFYYVK